MLEELQIFLTDILQFLSSFKISNKPWEFILEEIIKIL
jgi:hypothetical protein